MRDKKRYLIVTRIGVDIQRYPAIFAHLSQYEDRLRARTDQGNYWWELRSCDYYNAFDKPKIIYPDMAQEPRFTLDYTGTFFGNTAYMLAIEDKYLLGVLNSTPFWNLCLHSFAVFKGNTLRIFKQDLEQMPIPKASEDKRREIERLVDLIIDNPGEERLPLEAQIDKLVTELYGIKTV